MPRNLNIDKDIIDILRCHSHMPRHNDAYILSSKLQDIINKSRFVMPSQYEYGISSIAKDIIWRYYNDDIFVSVVTENDSLNDDSPDLDEFLNKFKVIKEV